jgi:hypothetical protein
LCPGFCLCRKAVIITFDTLGERFKKRSLLRVSDDFCQAMADGPAAAADGTFEQLFVKTVNVQVNFAVLEAFADGAFHNFSLCFGVWLIHLYATSEAVRLVLRFSLPAASVFLMWSKLTDSAE